ncbi:beta strand repeat-containing protein, partial [Azospirillum tabaci]|uniref:beta strand repeat-containing protein n=1 Tax=Azospirillum tabaci TaxID=2752310 RepID=UPI003CCCE8B2
MSNSNDFIHLPGDGRTAPAGANDLTQASTGNDVIDALDGNDTVYGGAGGDWIGGGGGDDQLFGEAGDDTLSGGAGNDSLDGGVGYDTLYGNDGDDTLLGGDFDSLDGGAGNDVLSLDNLSYGYAHGGLGDDSLTGGSGIQWLYGDAGNDTLSGGAGNDSLDGGAGNDSLDGGAGNDALYSGSGIDTLTGGSGGDVFNFSGYYSVYSGSPAMEWAGDRITDFEAGDKLRFTNLTLSASRIQVTAANGVTTLAIDVDNNGSFESALTLDGTFAADGLIVGNEGSDTVISLPSVQGTGSADFVHVAGDGRTAPAGTTDMELATVSNDAIFTGGGNDTVYGGAGGDWIGGGGGDDQLFGEAGDDTLSGGAGNDSLDGGVGYDTLYGNDGDDTLLGGDFDSLDGGAGNDVLSLDNLSYGYAHGGLGDDSLTGGSGIQWLYGDAGNDTLSGGAGNDSLDGGAGNDSLDGGAGNDALYSGSGIDTLTGGSGGDVFNFSGYYSVYSGSPAMEWAGDRITDFEAGDKLRFTNLTLSASRIQVTAANGVTTLAIDVDNNGSFESALTLDGTFAADGLIVGNEGNDTVILVPTTQGTTNDDFIHVAGDGHSAPSGANDRAIATAGPDIISALAGNDTVHAGNGHDWIDGGAGNDLLHGENGNDVLTGGAGNDTLIGGSGDDVAVFSGAFANYTITRSGTSVIVRDTVGSDGTDTLIGVETLFFTDRAVTLAAATGKIVSVVGQNNYISTNAGYSTEIGLADFTLTSASATQIVLTQTSGTDQIRLILNGSFTGNQLSDIAGSIDNIGTYYKSSGMADFAQYRQADQVGMTIAELRTTTDGAYFAGNDWLQGQDGNDTLYGYGGADTLYGAGGNDLINGGDGDDLLSGGAGNDTLEGGAGNDTAVFSGAYASYEITRVGSTLLVRDRLGTDGTDTLTGIESLTFSDRTISAPTGAAPRLDFDGNGRADVVWQNAQGGLTLWSMTG